MYSHKILIGYAAGLAEWITPRLVRAQVLPTHKRKRESLAVVECTNRAAVYQPNGKGQSEKAVLRRGVGFEHRKTSLRFDHYPKPGEETQQQPAESAALRVRTTTSSRS